MPAKRTSRNSAVKPDVSHIAESLRPLAIPIDTLNPDPANARKHSDRNLQTIQSSIAQFGQRTPIVVNVHGNVIEKGNGTWEAMKAAGHTHIAAVMVEDDPTTQVGYAIADNRAGELAEWDTDVLDAQLKALGETDFDLASIGFDEGELDSIIESVLPHDESVEPATKPDHSDEAKSESPMAAATTNADKVATKVFPVVVDCEDKEQRAELMSRLTAKGYNCRPILN